VGEWADLLLRNILNRLQRRVGDESVVSVVIVVLMRALARCDSATCDAHNVDSGREQIRRVSARPFKL